MVRFESDGESDFASIFASVAQEKREREEKRQTTLFLQVLDEMEATPEPHKGKHREFQQGHGHQGRHEESEGGSDADEADFEAFKEFMAFRRQQRGHGRSRHQPRKEYLRVEEDDEEDETMRLWRARQSKEKAARAEKVSRVHTINDLPRDDMDFFLGGSPLLDAPPELTIEEGRRLKDGERFYTASLPGWFEHLDLGVWMFRIELLILLALVVLLVGVYLGRRTMGAIRARRTAVVSAPVEAASVLPPQIIYAYPPPGMFQQQAVAPPAPVAQPQAV